MSSPLTLATALQRLKRLPLDRTQSVFIVGGALRDALLGRAVHDVDIAMAGDSAAFATAAADLLATRSVPIDLEHLGVHRLPLADGAIDIVQLQGDLETDLARRDLTINALAVRLTDLPDAGLAALDRGAVIDRHRGLADLAAGIVRFTSPRVVPADPLRALRAVRIATEIGFTVDRDSERAIADNARSLSDVAAERVGAELQRLFACTDTHHGVGTLETTGLLAVLFPELAAGRGVGQRPNHITDVYRHQLAALEWLDRLLGETPPSDGSARAIWQGLWNDAGWADATEVRQALAAQSTTLRLATLLHDIGKPATRTVEDDGRTRFFGHAELGAEMAIAICRRWRLPAALTTGVGQLVDAHLRPGQVAPPGQPATDRALFRFHRDVGEAVAPLCWLFLADSLATVGAEALLPRWPGYVAHVRAIIEWTPPPAATGLRSPIDGHAVMRATGLPPGPIVGQVLDALAEAAATGEVVDQRSALLLARKLADEERRGDSQNPRSLGPHSSSP
jgi:poly(A) polymerase